MVSSNMVGNGYGYNRAGHNAETNRLVDAQIAEHKLVLKDRNQELEEIFGSISYLGYNPFKEDTETNLGIYYSTDGGLI